MLHWNALLIDLVTSRSPCLSHWWWSSDSVLPEPLTHWAVTDRKFSAKDAVKFAVEGRWQALGGFKKMCKTSTTISLQNFAKKSAAGKTEFHHFPAVTKTDILSFPSNTSPRPGSALPPTLSLWSLPSHSPIDLYLSYIASPLHGVIAVLTV